MTLPDSVRLCDAIEMAAISLEKPLFTSDLAKQLHPGQVFADVEADLKDALLLADFRRHAAAGTYPFEVTDHSITFIDSQVSGTASPFNVYTFLLLGHSLEFGGPQQVEKMQRNFRKYFEDIVCWALKSAGFQSEVLSIPRRFRGLHTQLKPALRQLSTRFCESATLREDRLSPSDNDLDVDVIAAPIAGNSTRGGWPFINVQCATGQIEELQSKLQEGSETFMTVWDETGFLRGVHIRAVATPDDLLWLDDTHWVRLGQAGWVIDRTRIAYLSSKGRGASLLPAVQSFWRDIWSARKQIAWQSGWQGK